MRTFTKAEMARSRGETMTTCINCGLQKDTHRCFNCGWPDFRPEPKESETRKWSGHGDTSPDGRMLESDPQYAILKRAKKEWNR